MRQQNAGSRPKRSDATPPVVPVPGAVTKQLREFHGAEVKVLLALCVEQAKAGANTAFRCSIPNIIEATGLSERAITMALNALEKDRLLERKKHPGPAGNRYRIRLKMPVPHKQRPVTRPAAAATRKAKNATPKKRLAEAGSSDLFGDGDLDG